MDQALETGVLGFAAYFAAVLMLLRTLNRQEPALVVTATSVAAYVAMLVGATGLGQKILFWPVSVTYWFLALCFLMVFGAIYKSVSLRIVFDLYKQPNRSDRYEAILDRYVQRESYQDRLRILVVDGLATREPTGLQLTPKGHGIAAVAHALQRFFQIEHSG